MKYLLIVESPSKCLKIESFLPCKCISSKGHIRELNKLPKKGEEPIYEIIEEKRTHIESMKKVIEKYAVENIYLATDDDREGEAIAWHICQVFGLSVDITPRIIFHEVTKSALEKAIQSPGRINMDLVRAQQSRQVLDVMVGFRISPVLWKYLYQTKKNALSAGRCQTPALRLIYDNAVEKKDISLSYRITGLFYPKKIEFILSRELTTKEEVVGFLEASKEFRHTSTFGAKHTHTENAPRPFHTSGLLQSASSSLKMSPKEVMSGCQQLYQDGYITYMRTDSRLYCAEFIGEVRGFISREWGEKYVGDVKKLENKEAGNPHEAIRVTHLEVKQVEGLSGRIGKLYEFIWKNTVASCMSEYKGEQTPIYLSSPLVDVPYVHKIEVPVFLGWKMIHGSEKVMEQQTAGSALCMYIQSCPKEIVSSLVMAKVAIHGKHSHYTEASLISRLEDIGIGRPSTYASLVDTIIERGYVKKMDIDGSLLSVVEYDLENKKINEKAIEKRVGQEKGKLVIQPVGIMVCEFLTKHFGPLFEYDYTKEMELELDQIALGSDKDICSVCDGQIDKLIVPTEKIKCAIRGDKDHVVVFGRYGPMIQKTGAGSRSRELLSVKKDIDIGKLQRGEYSLDELVVKKEGIWMGEFNGSGVYKKTGPYGNYIEYEEEKISYKTIHLTEDATEEKAFETFMKYKTSEEKEEDDKSKKIIRELTNELSIRNGKYGAYIHYYKPDMKKPQFFKLKGFSESYRHCKLEVLMEWIKDTYNL